MHSSTKLDRSAYSSTSDRPYTEEEIRAMMQRVNTRIQKNLAKHKELAQHEK